MRRRDGEIIQFADLSEKDQKLVLSARAARQYAGVPATENACGAALRVRTRRNRPVIITGVNWEVRTDFPTSICAERGAAMGALGKGHKFETMAIALRPLGRYLCGICREFLYSSWKEMPVLNILNEVGDCCRSFVADLLPIPLGKPRPFGELEEDERGWVEQVLKLKQEALVVRQENLRMFKPRGAIFLVTGTDGKRRTFLGPDGYPGRSTLGDRAERVAELAARNAEGIMTQPVGTDPVLIVTVDNWKERPINGPALHTMWQFWPADCRILLVGSEGELVESSLRELFPCPDDTK